MRWLMQKHPVLDGQEQRRGGGDMRWEKGTCREGGKSSPLHPRTRDQQLGWVTLLLVHSSGAGQPSVPGGWVQAYNTWRVSAQHPPQTQPGIACGPCSAGDSGTVPQWVLGLG